MGGTYPYPQYAIYPSPGQMVIVNCHVTGQKYRPVGEITPAIVSINFVNFSYITGVDDCVESGIVYKKTWISTSTLSYVNTDSCLICFIFLTA